LLPDYPKTKGKLAKIQLERFKKVQSSTLFPFSNIPSSRIFEGFRIILVREDGTEVETKLELLRVERKIDYSQAENLKI
jgi:hypothetical protein